MITKNVVQTLWDEVTRQLIIIFGGEVFELAGPFLNREEAMAAAQAHCSWLETLALDAA